MGLEPYHPDTGTGTPGSRLQMDKSSTAPRLKGQSQDPEIK